MYDKDIREACKTNSFFGINFFVTIITLIITYNFSCDELLEGFIHTLQIFDLKGQIVKILESVLDLSALLANKLRTDFPSIYSI